MMCCCVEDVEETQLFCVLFVNAVNHKVMFKVLLWPLPVWNCDWQPVGAAWQPKRSAEEQVGRGNITPSLKEALERSG